MEITIKLNTLDEFEELSHMLRMQADEPAPKPEQATPKPKAAKKTKKAAPEKTPNPVQAVTAPPEKAEPVQEAAAAPEKAAEVPQAQESAPFETEQTYDFNALRTAAIKWSQGSGDPQALSKLQGIISGLGCVSLTDIKPEQYGALADGLKALGAAV